MSVATNLRKAAELAAIVKPAFDSSHCNVYSWGITFYVEPLELVRIFNLLNVRKSALQVSRTEEFTHLRFTSRGAGFVAMIKHEKLPEFYASLGASVQPKIAGPKQPRIDVRRPRPLLIPPSAGGDS
jgi:hypothetical protein